MPPETSSQPTVPNNFVPTPQPVAPLPQKKHNNKLRGTIDFILAIGFIIYSILHAVASLFLFALGHLDSGYSLERDGLTLNFWITLFEIILPVILGVFFIVKGTRWFRVKPSDEVYIPKKENYFVLAIVILMIGLPFLGLIKKPLPTVDLQSSSSIQDAYSKVSVLNPSWFGDLSEEIKQDILMAYKVQMMLYEAPPPTDPQVYFSFLNCSHEIVRRAFEKLPESKADEYLTGREYESSFGIDPSGELAFDLTTLVKNEVGSVRYEEYGNSLTSGIVEAPDEYSCNSLNVPDQYKTL